MKIIVSCLIALMYFISVSTAAEEDKGPAVVVDKFRAALVSGNREVIKDILADDVLIFEGDGVERSLDEYSSHHLESDIKFTQSVHFELIERSVIDVNKLAVISSRYKVSGSYNGNDIDLIMNETATVTRTDEPTWEIVRIHWSN